MDAKPSADQLRVLFYVGLSLLICHELDAVARHEWRLLPLFRSLEDDLAYTAFVLSHFPLFVGIFWATHHSRPALARWSQFIVDLALVAHGIAHFALSGHVLYEFEPPIETITVYGAAIIGTLHASLLVRTTRT